jgi:peroxiredoxin
LLYDWHIQSGLFSVACGVLANILEKSWYKDLRLLRVMDMTARRTLLACTMIAALLLSATGCKKKGPDVAPQPAAPDAGVVNAAKQLDLKIGPDFTLMDSTGKKVSLSDYEGSIVVLEWTSYECPFTARYYSPGSMVMMDTAARYSGSNVVWLAINSSYDATAAKNEEWRQKNKITYPVLDDHLGTVGKMYYASNTPQIVILDKERRVIYYGAMDNDAERTKQPADRINYVDKALGEFLSGKAVSMPRTPPMGCTVKYAPASAAVETK